VELEQQHPKIEPSADERAAPVPPVPDCLDLGDQRVCREFQPALGGSRRAFWTLTGVFLLGMASGTLPSPLYPLYQTEFGFSNAMVTIVFAFYGAGVLLALVGAGRWSDQLGRRPMLLVALGLAALSTLSFLLAQGLPHLFVGRFMSGLAIGVLSGTATAALVELEPNGSKRRASVVGGVVTPAGLGLGTLLAGAMIEYGPAPLRLIFAFYLGLLVLLAAAVLSLPETVIQKASGRPFRLQRLHLPTSTLGPFLIATAGVFATFAMMSTFAALVPSFLVQVLNERGSLLSGGVLAILFGAAAIAPPVIGRYSIRRAGTVGLPAVLGGLVLFSVGLAQSQLIPLLVGCAVAGFGGGCFFVGTLALINRSAPPDRRAEVVSAYFVAGYLGVTLPPIGVGVGSVSLGILWSVLIICVVVVLLATVAEIGMYRYGSLRKES